MSGNKPWIAPVDGLSQATPLLEQSSNLDVSYSWWDMFYGYIPGITVLWVPLFSILMVITALGIGFWLSALNLEYRDVMYTIPFLNQFLMFLAPVVYPISIVPEQWRVIYGLNPMVGVIEGFQYQTQILLFGEASQVEPT